MVSQPLCQSIHPSIHPFLAVCLLRLCMEVVIWRKKSQWLCGPSRELHSLTMEQALFVSSQTISMQLLPPYMFMVKDQHTVILPIPFSTFNNPRSRQGFCQYKEENKTKYCSCNWYLSLKEGWSMQINIVTPLIHVIHTKQIDKSRKIL